MQSTRVVAMQSARNWPGQPTSQDSFTVYEGCRPYTGTELTRKMLFYAFRQLSKLTAGRRLLMFISVNVI